MISDGKILAKMLHDFIIFDEMIVVACILSHNHLASKDGTSDEQMWLLEALPAMSNSLRDEISRADESRCAPIIDGQGGTKSPWSRGKISRRGIASLPNGSR